MVKKIKYPKIGVIPLPFFIWYFSRMVQVLFCRVVNKGYTLFSVTLSEGMAVFSPSATNYISLFRIRYHTIVVPGNSTFDIILFVL